MERSVAAEALRRANEQREKRTAGRRKRVIVGLLLATLALLWVSGRMDPLLSHVGLNYHDCVQNAIGATFCGADADRYQQEVQGALGTSPQDAAAAQANVRSSIPAAEAYYVDNGDSYAGMTVEALRQIDSGLAEITVASATAETYCIEAAAGTKTFSFRGPGGEAVPGLC